MKSFVKYELTKIKEFFISPTDSQDSYTISEKFKSFIVVFTLNIILIMVCSGILSILEMLKLINSETHAIEKYIKSYEPGILILLIVIIAPILEEIIFRAGLRYDKIIPLRIISYINMKQTGKTKEEIEYKSRAVWDKYFRYLFYSSTITFSLVHSFNFELNATLILLLPIIVLPQFITGFLCGYLRVKYNFIYSILLHVFNNGLFIGLTIIPMIMSGYYDTPQIGKTCIIETENYHLKIVEIEYSPINTTKIDFEYDENGSKADVDNNEFRIFNARNSSLSDLKTTLIQKNLRKSSDIFSDISKKKYNIEYYSKTIFKKNSDTVIKYFEQKTGERISENEQ